MRLLCLADDGNFSLIEHVGRDIPPYAILSHTWGADDEEVTFKDVVENTSKSKAGYRKLAFCGKQAAKDGLQFFWIDTCCIDKSSSAEISEAINSMFRWYSDAAKCYVYLSDVSMDSSGGSGLSSLQTWKAAFRNSRWFTRGWTLQELVAPACVEFFSVEGERLSDKGSLVQEIYEITGIKVQALQGNPLSQFSVDERMLWAEGRETKREEDVAYSLLGIFDIHMPLIYGEGRKKALHRLRRKIDKSPENELPALPPTEPLQDKKSAPEASCNIPFRRDADFVERGSLLHHIHEKCSMPASRIVLVGLGGVGKSQLAIEYCYQVKDRSPETWVFWVHASNMARLKQSYQEIAEEIQLPGRKDPQADVFKLVSNWLRNEKNGKWLLIFDNADDANVLFAQVRDSQTTSVSSDRSSERLLTLYLPQSKNGSILITTRTREVALRLAEERDIISIGPMNNKNAEALLEKKLGEHVEKDCTAELAAALEFMPLAIVQAAGYIKERAPRCSVRDYLAMFYKNDKKKMGLLHHDGGHLRRDWEANNSILITWQLSFDHIVHSRPSAADLLSLMSFCDRQGIPEALVRNRSRLGSKPQTNSVEGKENDSDDSDDGASEGSVDDEFEDDILTLRHYSLISVTTDASVFEMHALVQLATRKWLESQGQLEEWKRKYITRLCREFPSGGYENWATCRELFPHAKSALAQQPEGEDSLKEWALLLYHAAWYAWKQGNAADAEKLSVKSMKVRRQLLGIEKEETLISMGMVALVNKMKGKWNKAEELEVQIMEISKKIFGADHPDTLVTTDNLAVTYQHQGRWNEAEELQIRTVEAKKRVLGPENPETLIGMGNLALTYRNQGRWSKAEELEVQVIEMKKRALGPEHPETLTSMGNLALTYRKQGRWSKAEDLEVQVIEMKKRVLGPEHPETLITIDNLASTYQDQGRWNEAEEIQMQMVETSKKIFGVDHPDTLVTTDNLALTYQYQGRWNEAEVLQGQVIEAKKRIFGPEHPETLNSMGNLALTYYKQGRWNEAEELEVQVLGTRKRVLGPEHPDTLTSMNNLAYTLKNQGHMEKAMSLMKECSQLRERILGPKHPSTTSSLFNLNEWQLENVDING